MGYEIDLALKILVSIINSFLDDFFLFISCLTGTPLLLYGVRVQSSRREDHHEHELLFRV